MRKLKIDMADLEIAFDYGSGMISAYLDTETGEIISISDDDKFQLQVIYESYYDEQTETVDWESAFREERVPDWQRESLRDADRIKADFSNRFKAIPSQRSFEGYRDMEAFIATVRDPRLQVRLERAISGRGAFRYFKDVLLDYPTERKRWFQFQQDRLYQRMLDWLESEGISPL
jgi:hypothetical protein